MAVRTTNRQLEYATWPSSGIAVTNTGLGGAGYNATETANHYALFGSQTAQGITTNSEVIIAPKGAAINNPSALTMEWVFRYDASTNTAYLFGKGTQYYAMLNNEQFAFWRLASAGVSFFQCSFTLVPGHWYDLQVSWGSSSSTPICKLNNVAQTITNILHRTGAWADDSGYDLKVMNGIYQNGALRSTIEVFRFYDAALSDAELQANYAVDNARLYQVVAWAQGSPPNVAVDDATLESIVGIDNAWHEGAVEPDVGAAATTPTATVVPTTFSVSGNATAQAYTPSVASTHFPDVPPANAITLTPEVRGKLLFNPIVGEG